MPVAAVRRTSAPVSPTTPVISGPVDGVVVADVHGQSVESLDQELRPGTVLNAGEEHKFRIVRKLGEGTWSLIFCVEDANNASAGPHALKVTPIHGDMAKAAYKDVLRLRGLQHKHILRLHDSFTHRPTPLEVQCLFMRMEYCERGSLEHVIRQKQGQGKQFSPATISNYVSQLASALEYIHSKDMIHGDFRPANILCTADKQLKLCGFGCPLRLHRNGTAPLSITGGAMAYTPPECRLPAAQYPTPPPVSSAYDMWGLGVVLGELATTTLIGDRSEVDELTTQTIMAHDGAFCNLALRLLIHEEQRRASAEEVLTLWKGRFIWSVSKAVNKSSRRISTMLRAL